MRSSQFFLSTLKEAPTEAELPSHRLMLRAGLIKKLGNGLYTWMPLGLRVLRKVEAIVRQEMNASGAIELLMPAVQPAELWQQTGRWAVFGPQMLKIKDRHAREFCFGPTHEEVITDVARTEIKSYRQLPVNFYQVQTKFRDEVRPRFGVMRAREFIMKDAYSFHSSLASLQSTYAVMYQTYSTIFTRLGLRFRAVAADTGAIGGDGSHEFHVLADSGEDGLAICEQSDFAANVELAEALAPSETQQEASQAIEMIATPQTKACADVAALLGISTQRIVKTLAIIANKQFILALLRADHTLNEVKIGKLVGLADWRFANEEEVQNTLHCATGYIGAVNVDAAIRIIADRTVASMNNFVCGANQLNQHYQFVNWAHIAAHPQVEIADIRNIEAGDASPDGKGHISLCRGIEVGHIFQLRTKYAEALNCTFLNEQGKPQVMEMGCYGIGVSRIVGAAIEQNHDEKGIIFPESIAPFSLAIVPIGYDRSAEVKATADALYRELQALGVDVLLDDRNERPGVLFADIELIGIPHRVTIGDRGLKNGEIEYQARRASTARPLKLEGAAAWLHAQLA